MPEPVKSPEQSLAEQDNFLWCPWCKAPFACVEQKRSHLKAGC